MHIDRVRGVALRQPSIVGLILLILLSIQPAYTQATTYSPSTSGCLLDRVKVNYSVSVIPVGLSPEAVGIMASSLGGDVYVLRIYDCIVYLNISYIVVDPGEWFSSALGDILSAGYEDLGKPVWVLDYEDYSGLSLNVKWVRLTSFYKQLSLLVNATLSIMGVRSNDTVVVIGDIDGVSRQYYDYTNYNYTARRYLELEGVRGWAGPYPVSFYDLSVVAKPRPEGYMPYARLGRSTNYTDEPPIWSFNNSEEVGEYVAGLVRDHVRFHVASLGDIYYSPLSVLVNVTILDFGDEDVVGEIEGNLSKAEIAGLVGTIAPWVDVEVSYSVVDAMDYPLLYRIIVNSPVNDEGFMEIDFTAIAGLLSKIAGEGVNRGVNNENASYNFIILATPKPSLFKMGRGFKFTAISLGPWGASSYPGFGYRIYNGGLPRVIAHELGHSMGEPHPFQFREDRQLYMRWLMDWTATIMAYDDNVIAGFIRSKSSYVPDYYTVFRQSLIYGIRLIHNLYGDGKIDHEDAMLLLRELTGNPIRALKQILDSYYSRSNEAPTETTVTKTVTQTVIETKTVTLNTTITLRETLTETRTTTKTSITTNAITYTETRTRTRYTTITSTTTVTEPATTKTTTITETTTATKKITETITEANNINPTILALTTILAFILGIIARTLAKHV